MTRRKLAFLLPGLWMMGLTASAQIQATGSLPTGAIAGVGGKTTLDAFDTQFTKVWETVQDKFYDKTLSGLNWKHIGDIYRARLAGVKTKTEFQDLVNQMLAELHASHTFYATDDDIEFYMLPAVMGQDMQGHQVEHIGIMGKASGHEYLVTAVMDGSPAQKSGIQSGDRLLSADGQPFTSAGSFRGKEGQPVKIELRREGENELRTVLVSPVKQNILRAFLDAMDKSARITNIGNKKIAYVHLWTMANDAFRVALDRLVEGRLHDSDGLILDLRDGFGGNPFGYSDSFFRPDVAWEQEAHGQKPVVRHTGYGQPIVILINAGTRSAKEFLTYEMKSGHRAIVVGTRTAGAFLGAGAFSIGKEGLLELAVIGLRLDGARLEASGVTPDIEVTTNHAYTAEDLQRIRAEKILTALIQQRSQKGGDRVVQPSH